MENWRPQTSKTLASRFEKSLDPSIRDNVKLHRVETHPEKPRFSFPIRFRYGFHVLTFREIQIDNGKILLLGFSMI